MKVQGKDLEPGMTTEREYTFSDGETWTEVVEIDYVEVRRDPVNVAMVRVSARAKCGRVHVFEVGALEDIEVRRSEGFVPRRIH